MSAWPTSSPAFSSTAGLPYEGHSKEVIGAKVAAISVDSQFTHLAWVNTDRKEGGLGQVNFPLIADLNKDMPKSDEEPKASEDVEVTLPPLVNEDGIRVRRTRQKRRAERWPR